MGEVRQASAHCRHRIRHIEPTTAIMSEGQVTLRTRKFIRNPLLGRKQMVVDVLHPSRPNVSKDELRTKLSELYKSGKDQVSVFGFRPHYRLVRYGMANKIEKASRQQRMQRKNRSKEFRGTAKTKGASKDKKK